MREERRVDDELFEASGGENERSDLLPLRKRDQNRKRKLARPIRKRKIEEKHTLSEQTCELIDVFRRLPQIELLREETSDPDEKGSNKGRCNMGVVNSKTEVRTVRVPASLEGREEESVQANPRQGKEATHGARQISNAA